MTPTRILPRLASLLLAALFLSAPALATWSIVVVKKKTREVCVASATCIGGKFPLKRWLPVVVVDEGVAAAQSAVDTTASNRILIWDSIHAGDVPGRILQKLQDADPNHQTRQYGIVTFGADPVTFTGSGAGDAKHGVTGETDELIYAIQGNVLAGDAVVTETEKTLLTAPGDLGQRVMAAMETARAWGGDGRCSCSQSDPDGCGAPPPGSWKSAHTAFIVMARPGDEDGVCNSSDGCASGNYYLSKVVKGQTSDPDPIFELQKKYDTWRANKVDMADHVHSRMWIDRHSLVADGASTAVVRVQLRDVDDSPLTAGGHKFELRWVGEGEPTATMGKVTDHGGGVYTFPLTATHVVGRGGWVVRTTRPGEKWVQLLTPLVLPTEVLIELHAGKDEVSAADGTVPFTLNRGPADAGRGYLVLGSASGTSPGVFFGNVKIPLNRDHLYQWTWTGAGAAFPGSSGLLDADGRAEALLDLPPSAWASFAGNELAFCALLGGPPYEVTNVVNLEVTP